MKKILFTSGDITRCGGTENVGTQIMNALAELPEYEVAIVSLFESTEKTFFPLSEKVRRYTLFDATVSLSKKYLTAVLRLRRMIQKEKYDYVIDIDVILSLVTLPATFRTQCKVYSWEHFHYHENLGCRLRSLARKLICHFSDGIIVLSLADQKNYKNTGTRVPIYQIYNPILETECSPDYSTERKVILSVGRLTYQKGFDQVPMIASKFFERHPDWEWVIVGEGEDREKIESEIAKYHLEKQIKLVGRQDAQAWYSKASFFVLPSRFEGFGIVLIEAFENGIPCITFNCPCGPDEIVMNELNGYVVNMNDFDGMAQRINSLIEHPETRVQMSEKTHESIQKFSLSKIIKQWEQILN